MDMDMNLTFDTSVIAGYFVQGAASILLAVVLLIIWQRRTHEKIQPVVAGAVMFFAFAVVIKVIPAYLLTGADTPLAKTVRETPVLYYLVGGILAGLLEETGRFIAYRFFLKKYTGRRTAISYGIGHGGFEAAYFGMSFASIGVMGILINQGQIGQVIGDLPAEQVPAALEQLHGFADTTFFMQCSGIIERISAVFIQIAASIMVFAAVHDRRKRWLFPLAMLLHAAIDFGCILYATHPILTEVLLAAVSAAMFTLSIRLIYRKLPEKVSV